MKIIGLDLKNNLKNWCYTCFVFIFMSVGAVSAQVLPLQFSLDDAVKMAQKTNYESLAAQKDLKIAKNRLTETTATGLPQISAEFSYTYYPDLPQISLDSQTVALVPESAAVFQLRATQLIFDASYLVGLKAARAYIAYSQRNKEKAMIEVKKACTQAYVSALVTSETVKILAENLANIDQNVVETEKLYLNGLVEVEELEQLEILQTDAETALRHAQNLKKVAHRQLVLNIGLPTGTVVVLTQTLDMLVLESSDRKFFKEDQNLENNIDKRILAESSELQKLNFTNEKSGFLPTVEFEAAYNSGNNVQDESVFLMTTVKMPIFSSLGRLSKTKQARLEWEKAELMEEKVNREIKIKYQQTLSEYRQAFEDQKSALRTLTLSQKILDKNQIKYKEGIVTSFDITRTFQQLHDAQQAYLGACATLINKKVELETLVNQ